MRAFLFEELGVGHCLLEFALLGFQLFDFLQVNREDHRLLNTRLQVAPDIRLDQRFEPSAQGWQVTRGQLCRTRGLAFTGNIDPDTAILVASCNGQQRLGDLLSGLAARRNVSRETILPEYLAVIRQLIGRGFLLPAGWDEQATGQLGAPLAAETAEPHPLASADSASVQH